MSPSQQEFEQELTQATLQLSAFADFVLAWITYTWAWLRSVLADAGLPPLLQTAVLLAVLMMFAVTALRLLGGTLRILLVIVAGLLIARALGAAI